MSYNVSVTQCPKCHSVGTYQVNLQNGTQILYCNRCLKNFHADVKQAMFTGRNR